jgi:hypothetical protein
MKRAEEVPAESSGWSDAVAAEKGITVLGGAAMMDTMIAAITTKGEATHAREAAWSRLAASSCGSSSSKQGALDDSQR